MLGTLRWRFIRRSPPTPWVALALLLGLLSGCGGGGGGGGKPPPVSLVSIRVDPSHATISSGTDLLFSATGTYSDGATKDLTAEVDWTTSPPSLATVSNSGASRGLVRTLQPGTLNVVATFDGISGAATLDVAEPELLGIEISPSSPTIAVGTGARLAAVGVFTGDLRRDLTAEARWETSNGAVATVSDEEGTRGEVAGASPGTATVTASLGAAQGSTSVTVTDAVLVALHLTPTNPQLPLGTSARFQALGTYSSGPDQDLTAAVTWSSSDPGTATIATSGERVGEVTPHAVGTTTVEASYQGFQTSSSLTVTAATLLSITLSTGNSSLALGTSTRLWAAGVYSDGSQQDLTGVVSWGSSDPAVASVSGGTATGTRQGTTTLSASFGGRSGSTPLTVTEAELMSIEIAPFQPSIALGTTLRLSATGLYSDGSFQDLTEQVTWASAAPDVAPVANAAGTSGTAAGAAVGSAAISASLRTVKGSTELTVTPAALISINVDPFNAGGPVGTALVLRAIGNFSDGSTQDLTSQVKWEISAPEIATVQQGRVSLIGAGGSTVSATWGGIVGFSPLSATSASLQRLDVTPAEASLPAGRSRQFAATGTFSDGTAVDLTGGVTWVSGDDSVAKVSNAPGSAGVVVGARVGSTDISALSKGLTGTTRLRVTGALLAAIEISPPNPALIVGQQRQLKATGRYSDLSEEDLTSQVTWTSGAPGVARVSNAPDSHGLVKGVGAGSGTITASLAGVTGQTTATVTFDPIAPVSAAVTMSPNVILDTGTDPATVSVTVRATDPQRVVPDGTLVSFAVTRGSALLASTSARTVNGVAATTLTSTAPGPLVVTATVQGTEIRGWAGGLVATNFGPGLGVLAGSKATVTGTTVEPGSQFLLAVLNRSNRPFTVALFEFRNGDAVLMRTASFPSLADGKLRSGTWLVAVVTLTQPVADAGLTAGFLLRDVTLGTEFGLGARFRTTP